MARSGRKKSDYIENPPVEPVDPLPGSSGTDGVTRAEIMAREDEDPPREQDIQSGGATGGDDDPPRT